VLGLTSALSIDPTSNRSGQTLQGRQMELELGSYLGTIDDLRSVIQDFWRQPRLMVKLST
jgi:hypothetical protein